MLDVIKIIATAAAAFCWFRSARVALTPIASGIDELDKVKLLSDDLQKMGKWNFWVATYACVAAIIEVITWIVY
jgi:hypothetical protein